MVKAWSRGFKPWIAHLKSWNGCFKAWSWYVKFCIHFFEAGCTVAYMRQSHWRFCKKKVFYFFFIFFFHLTAIMCLHTWVSSVSKILGGLKCLGFRKSHLVELAHPFVSFRRSWVNTCFLLLVLLYFPFPFILVHFFLPFTYFVYTLIFYFISF